MKAALLIKLEGIVQGVGFRYFAHREAEKNDLVGYVQNMPDGSIESYVEGDKENLANYLEAMKRGPAFSDVTNVKVEWPEWSGKYNRFQIKH